MGDKDCVRLWLLLFVVGDNDILTVSVNGHVESTRSFDVLFVVDAYDWSWLVIVASAGGESTDENPLVLPDIETDVDGGEDEDAGVNNVGING